MSKIADAVNRNAARIQAGGPTGVQPETASAAPVAAQISAVPPTPPQDLPLGLGLPQRGMLPSQFVMDSDRSDSSRAFRGAGARSSAFQFPLAAQPVAAQTKSGPVSQAWDSAVTYPAGAHVGRIVGNVAGIFQANQQTQGQDPAAAAVVDASAPSISPATPPWTQIGSGTIDGLVNGVNKSAVSVQVTDAFGRIDPSLPGYLPNGSLCPRSSSAFSFSSTTTTITISWSAFNIFQVNGNVIEVGSGSQLVTGLTASTNYFIFPYFDPTNSTINFVTSTQVLQAVQLSGVSVAGSGTVTTASTLSISDTSSQLSVEMWVYPTAASGTLLEFGNNNAAGGGPYVALNGQVLEVHGSAGVFSFANAGTALLNFWNHILVTFSYAAGPTVTITVYLNGVQVNSGSETSNAISNSKWAIAKGGGGGALGNSSGIFSHVAIYNGLLLTGNQVTSHLNAMLNSGSGAYDSLVLADGASFYWKLDETSGTTAADSSGANTGTYTGTFTLDDLQTIGGSNGEPSVAFQNPSIAVAVFQFAQGYTPLSPGGILTATTASGSASGVFPSFTVPGLPSSLPGVV